MKLDLLTPQAKGMIISKRRGGPRLQYPLLLTTDFDGVNLHVFGSEFSFAERKLEWVRTTSAQSVKQSRKSSVIHFKLFAEQLGLFLKDSRKAMLTPIGAHSGNTIVRYHQCQLAKFVTQARCLARCWPCTLVMVELI